MKRAMIALTTVVMLAGMLYGFHVKHDTYALIKVDQNGNEWITDQYLTYTDCQSQPHNECRPMGEIE